MAWHGMVWYGIVWYGMVWYGMVWHDMAWYWYWYGTVWYGIRMKYFILHHNINEDNVMVSPKKPWGSIFETSRVFEKFVLTIGCIHYL
jgi:hypothetical protein